MYLPIPMTVLRALLNDLSCWARLSRSFSIHWFESSKILTSVAASRFYSTVRRVTAWQFFTPALPVLPILWMWSSLSLEKSKFITVLRKFDDMSRPRAATLVATRIKHFFCRKFWRICALSIYYFWPCKAWTWSPYENTSNSHIASTVFIWLANTSTCEPSVRYSFRFFCSQLNLFYSASKIKTLWLTSSLAIARLSSSGGFPIDILTGHEFSISHASSCTFLGNVAENISVYLSGLIWFTIDLIWYSKPKSNILSASSITRKVHLEVKVNAFFFRNSINFPGVEMQISFTLCLIYFQSTWGSTPPKIGSTFSVKSLAYLQKIAWICWQSSLVGANTMPIGPSSWFKAGYSKTCTKSGKR